MVKEKVNETAWNLNSAVQEANQAIADSAAAAYERNMKFAQVAIESGAGVFKSHAEGTRALMQELVEQPQWEQGAFQKVLESAVAAQERNLKFSQSMLQNGTELLKSHVEGTRVLMQKLAEQTRKEQEAFQGLARESMNAYIDFFAGPFSYYQHSWEAAESMAWQGVETAQKITRQGLEVVQKAAQQGQKAVESTANSK